MESIEDEIDKALKEISESINGKKKRKREKKINNEKDKLTAKKKKELMILNATPEIKLNLKNHKLNFIHTKDIRKLISYIYCSGVGIQWAIVKQAYSIQKIVVLCLSSLQSDLFEKAIESQAVTHIPTFFSEKVLTKAPGNFQRMYEGVTELLKHPISKTRLAKLRKERNQGIATPKVFVKTDEPEKEFDIMKEYCKYLLSYKELSLNCYPLPENIDDSFTVIPKLDGDFVDDEFHKILAIDCEMALTENGPELTRVSVVDHELRILYDKLVKPSSTIINYRTEYSGISEETLRDVTTTLEDVKKDLLKFIGSSTVLVGHSLENDLIALKLVHYRVIDTAILFPHPKSGRYKHSLKFLAETYLNETIQESTHDSIVDAQTAMKLALLKFKNGELFGVDSSQLHENFLDTLQRQNKKCAMIDDIYMCRNYSGLNTDCFPEFEDKKIAEQCIKAIQSDKYHFIYARFNKLENYYKALSEGSNEHPTDVTKEELNILKNIDSYIKEIYESLPRRTLMVVTGAHGNIHKVIKHSKRRKEKKELEKWSDDEEKEFLDIINRERNTVTFFKVVS